MARKASWQARLGLLTVSTVLSLGLVEVGWRWWSRSHGHTGDNDDAWRRELRRVILAIYQRSSNPLLVYEPRPGAWTDSSYGRVGFNQASMRDPHEVPESPPSEGARPRLALLGDSIVFGEELRYEETLAPQLDAALEHRAEVLNFGVSGYDTQQERVWYEQHVRRFRPRALVLVYCFNDVMIMSGPFGRLATPEEQARKDAQDALLDRLASVRAETLDDVAVRDEDNATWKSLTHVRWRLRISLYDRSTEYRDEYTVLYAQPDRLARIRSEFTLLGRALRDDGVHAHLLISPVFRSWERYHWTHLHTQLAQLARSAGFHVHDPLQTWQRSFRPEQLRMPGDALHYRARGNAELANFLAPRVQPSLAAPLTTNPAPASAAAAP